MDSELQSSLTPRRKRRNRRLTIGMLIQSPAAGPQLELEWQGVVDMAREQEVNLICFSGGALYSPHAFEAQANVLYDLASTEQLDGMVIWSSNVGMYITPKQVKGFFGHFHPLPMVSGAYAVPGIPSILQSNAQGMREAMVHLIKVHGCRRIAFLRGPEKHFGAQERYQAYVHTLLEHNLRLNPILISPPVNWTEGAMAMTVLLDERKLLPPVDFDAIVAASDHLILEAMTVLQGRGIHVPNQVAVIGYDDSAFARIAMPSLTSVVTPFYELGRQAVVLLLHQIRGKRVPEQTTLPGELIIRQSCGCLSPLTAQAAAGRVTPARGSLGPALAKQRECILTEMQQAIGTFEPARTWAELLLDSFTHEMTGKGPNSFLPELDEILRQVMNSGGNVSAWQGVLSTLRRQTLPYLKRESLTRAEDLWHQARIAVGEAAARVQARESFHAEQRAQMLREIGAAMITTFDVDELMNMLAQNLPRLGIPSCYLALYQDPHKPAEGSRLLLGYNEQGRIHIEPGGQPFPSRQLIPEVLFPQGRRYNFIIEPLYFRENQLGFVLFEVGPLEPSIYQVLSAQISSALQGAVLVRALQQRSAEIIRQNYVLDTFMANVPDRIYFKDCAGHIIKANRAHAQSRGLDDPAEEIGKSDFDFFPSELAQHKYDQEQEIIRTGQPLLNLEEPDDKEQWILTTKMPLRDEHGQIIGTFGVSRDITEIKQTQSALRRAHDELEMRVQERTAELLNANQALADEIVERKRAEAEIHRLNQELEQRVHDRTAALEASNNELADFSYSVSHNLRAPLRHIDGFLELLQKRMAGSLDAQSQHYMASISDSAKRMGLLIDSLLSFSGMRRQELSKTPVDLNALVREAIQALEPEVAGRTIRWHLAALPLVAGDRAMLRLVLVNLLANALKFTRPRAVAEIEIGCMPTSGTEVVIYIRDNGVGFDSAYADKLFGVFQRLHHEDEFEGTGIGLANVRRIINRHGGRVWAEGQVDQGATFYFSLPQIIHGRA